MSEYSIALETLVGFQSAAMRNDWRTTKMSIGALEDFKSMIMLAEPLWIAPAITSLIQMNRITDGTLHADTCFIPFGFAYYAHPPATVGADRAKLNALAWGLYQGQLNDSKPWVAIVSFGEDENGVIGPYEFIVPWQIGQSASENIEVMAKREMGPGARLAAAWIMSEFLTLQEFLKQRLISRTRQSPDRAAFRRLPPEIQQQSPVITVVALRRHESKRKEGEPTPVDWACRWAVRGHWRQQWYPSQNRHRLKFIPAYVKGPDDKPFRSTMRLFAAVR